MNFSPNGSLETILVVDDNEHVRRLVVAILGAESYRILSAKSAPEASKLAYETKGPIELLSSKVDFPEISGPDMGELLKKSRSNLRVMLMSGGKYDSLLAPAYGWAYIHKPFIGEKLSKMVYDVLNSKDRSQPGGQGFDGLNDNAKAAEEAPPLPGKKYSCLGYSERPPPRSRKRRAARVPTPRW